MTLHEWKVHVGWFDARGFFHRRRHVVMAPTLMEARSEAYRKHRKPNEPFTAYQNAVAILKNEEVTP